MSQTGQFLTPEKHLKTKHLVLPVNGGPSRNRTYVNRFGDDYSTSELWTLSVIYTLILQKGQKKTPISGAFLEIILFLDFLVLSLLFAPFAILFELDLFSNEFLVFAGPVIYAFAGRTGKFYKSIL